MGLANVRPPVEVELTVSLDGEHAVVVAATNRTVGDVIRAALRQFSIDEDARSCHLAGADRLYMPHEVLGDTDVEDGVGFALRLPF